jgi:hypothetical protein
MVIEQWLRGEETLPKERRVTGRESTAFGSVSNNSIAPERNQIQPIFSYIDLVNCNLDKNTKAVCMRAHYKCVAQKVKPDPLSDGSMPDAEPHWRR